MYDYSDVTRGLNYHYLSGYVEPDKSIDHILMRELIQTMSPLYTCKRPPGAAGALLVTQDGLIVFGDVAPADGSKTCKELGTCMIECDHCVRTIHAEVRTIINCAKLGISTVNATLYSILKPCYQCTKVIVAAGITKIVYARMAYDEKRTLEVISNAPQHIEIYRLTDIELPYGR